MVHGLTVQSVILKTTIFEKASRLINTNEATAAVGLAYQKAGAALPEIQVGHKVADLIKSIPESVYAAAGEKLTDAIQSYVYRDEDEVTEDALRTYQMGYAGDTTGQ